MPAEKLGIIVLASGNGSNLEAIMRSCETGQINAEVLAVICNKPGAYCLERAKNHRVPGHAVDHRDYGRKRVPKVPRQWMPAEEEMRILKTSRLGEDEETLIRRLAHEKAVSEIADRYSPGLIVMAGYNQRFDLPGVMNIHPAL